MNNKRVYYIWDNKLIDQCNRLPAVLGRASMVHELIVAYELLTKTSNIQVVRSQVASFDDLKEFHSELYLDHLKSFTDIDDDYMSSRQDEEYGIGYDCPPVSNMYNLVSTIAGASVTAAKCLILGMTNVAINWCGGWHHAHRFGAEGFCYVNDIVIAIEKLRTKFPKVLYVDLDVHHGNGVQDAFNLSKTVFTLSFHKYEPGFYPGTGSIDDIGTLAGKGYACNFPLHASYSDDTLQYAFEKVFTLVYDKFAPDAIVVQCGADALAGDPHGGGRLTERSYCHCVRAILNRRKPTMLLGGGGYKHPNAARLWTSITALAACVSVDENIPEHSYWPHYGPDYMLPVEPTLAKDMNDMRYLDDCIDKIIGNLDKCLYTNKDKEPLTSSEKKRTDLRNISEIGQKTNEMTTFLINQNESKSNVKTQSILTKETNLVEADVYTFVD